MSDADTENILFMEVLYTHTHNGAKNTLPQQLHERSILMRWDNLMEILFLFMPKISRKHYATHLHNKILACASCFKKGLTVKQSLDNTIE